MKDRARRLADLEAVSPVDAVAEASAALGMNVARLSGDRQLAALVVGRNLHLAGDEKKRERCSCVWCQLWRIAAGRSTQTVEEVVRDLAS